MSDYIVMATAASAQIRVYAADTRNTVEEARRRHNTTPVCTAALGRLLTAGAIMGSMMKGEKDIMTLRINAGGPIGGITVTADSFGGVKGYVGNPNVDIPLKPNGKLDVSGAVGVGFLDVIKDLGLKEPYVGQTPLQTSEIAEDITFYFASSEQVPSSVGLGVLVDRDYTVKVAGGFIIQLMPFADEETIEKLEQNLSSVTSVTDMLDSGKTPEDIIKILCDGLDPVFNDTLPVEFRCNCSKERVEKALISIGKEELQSMIDDGEPIELNCHFCNTYYTFEIDELKELLKSAK